MSASLLEDAFAHQTWATLRLIDACGSLTPEQLASDVPAGFGSILRTLQHIVGSDSFDLAVLAGTPAPTADTKEMGLQELRAEVQANAKRWTDFLATSPDHAAMVREVDPDDGYQRDAPVGLRLAAALEHGNEHRTQVCAGLTTIGVEPPSVGVLDFGLERGAVVEVYPEGWKPPG